MIRKKLPLLVLFLIFVFSFYSAQINHVEAAPGDITNLNFGINNSYPWIMSICGDIRMDNGITNKTPYGQSTLTTNSTCMNPGIIFSGNGSINFGQGQASATNQVVGGATYPEVYSSAGTNGIFSSYSYLNQKASSGGLVATDLASVCTLSSCSLPNNFSHGIYKANGDVTLNSYTFKNNNNYVFLINGNLTLNGDIITPDTSSSFFAVSGNIIVPASVGSPTSVTTANLSGIFSTDRSFIMQSNNNCTDLRLNVEGVIVVNAGRTGSQLQNLRDLCGENGYVPTLQITQRLDYILSLPDIVKTQSVVSQEVAP